MEIDNQKTLIGILIITLLLFPAVVFAVGPLRVALSLPFGLFFPGYTLLSAVFPRRDDLAGFHRTGFSMGLSVAVLILIGVALNYTPMGIEPFTVLGATTLFIVITSAIAWQRQRRLPEADRLRFTISSVIPGWAAMTVSGRVLSLTLVAAVLTAIGSLGYVISTPQPGDAYTEFYILTTEDRAEEYPREVSLGDPLELKAVIVNQENRSVSYRIEVRISGETVAEVDAGTLEPGDKWEKVIKFFPRMPGENQKVEFYLYANGKTEPHLKDPLHIFVHVR